jgi:hypothetical protein
MGRKGEGEHTDYSIFSPFFHKSMHALNTTYNAHCNAQINKYEHKVIAQHKYKDSGSNAY